MGGANAGGGGQGWGRGQVRSPDTWDAQSSFAEGSGNQPTPVFLPGESHGRRSLVGCSPQGRKELDTTEQLHFHFLSTLLLC